jgi:hypothetical protein
MLQANSGVFVVLAVETEMGTFGIWTLVDGELGCVLEVRYRSEFVLDFGGVGGDGCETVGE